MLARSLLEPSVRTKSRTDRSKVKNPQKAAQVQQCHKRQDPKVDLASNFPIHRHTFKLIIVTDSSDFNRWRTDVMGFFPVLLDFKG